MIMVNEKEKLSRNTKRRRERKTNMDWRMQSLSTKIKQAKMKKYIDKIKTL